MGRRWFVKARILTGTCSWTDPTLIACERFYPSKSMSARERLEFYARHFPIVEVDSTFYGPPKEETSRLWAERTPPGFVFDVKAFGLLTGHGAPLERLPPEVRGTAEPLPAKGGRPRNVYLKDLAAEQREQLWEIHRQALWPLHAAGKLGAVLFQFPPWFLLSQHRKEYLRRIPERLPDFRIAVEFRGGGWMTEETAAGTLAFLEAAGLAYVSVDEPQGFPNSVPPLAAATTGLAYVRLHGRNAETWDKKGSAASDRFNYLYTDHELREWVPRVRLLAESAAEVHVLFNNNHEDVGVRNARQMAAMLDVEVGGLVSPPGGAAPYATGGSADGQTAPGAGSAPGGQAAQGQTRLDV
jgi:uncharacterized protein YecE (DUF72 family)